MKKVLITGADGQLGRSIRSLSKDYPSIKFICADKAEMNITDRDAVLSFFGKHKPDFCINCAAYTQVDMAEQEPEEARLINVEAVINLIEACNEQPAVLFQISTDFVFDGKSATPYSENAEPKPLSIYGQTKLEGEQRVITGTEMYCVIRTSWVFSEFGNNFVKKMLQLSETHSKIEVVKDQVGCPTYARDLAAQILDIIGSGKALNETYHFCNQGATTWYDFAKEIFSKSGKQIEVLPITSKYFAAPAKRPEYSVLDCSKIQKEHGSLIRPWRYALWDCIQRL